jgi:hypothetical protein
MISCILRFGYRNNLLWWNTIELGIAWVTAFLLCGFGLDQENLPAGTGEISVFGVTMGFHEFTGIKITSLDGIDE